MHMHAFAHCLIPLLIVTYAHRHALHAVAMLLVMLLASLFAGVCKQHCAAIHFKQATPFTDSQINAACSESC